MFYPQNQNCHCNSNTGLTTTFNQCYQNSGGVYVENTLNFATSNDLTASRFTFVAKLLDYDVNGNNISNPSGYGQLEIWNGNTLVAARTKNVDVSNNTATFEESATDLGLTTNVTYTVRFIGVGAYVDGRALQQTCNGAFVNELAGGLRIKSISTSDGDANQTNDIVKDFVYTELGATTSSGRLVSKPVYKHEMFLGYTVQTPCASNPVNNIHGYIISSASVVPMQSTQGSHIGYRRVMVDMGDMGKSAYTYSVGDQSVLYAMINLTDESPQAYPINPHPPFDPRLGNLEQEWHEDKNGVVVSKTDYFYDYFYNSIQDDIQKIVPFNNGEMLFNEFSMFTGRSVMKRVKNTNYDNSGNETVTTENETFYESDRHYMPTRERQTNSDGTVLETEYTYVADIDNGCAAGLANDLALDKTNYLNSWENTFNQHVIAYNAGQPALCPGSPNTTDLMGTCNGDNALYFCRTSQGGLFYQNQYWNQGGIKDQYNLAIEASIDAYDVCVADLPTTTMDIPLKTVYEMQEAYMIALPLEQTTWRTDAGSTNRTLISAAKYNYENIGSGGNHQIYLNSLQNFEIATPIPEANFTKLAKSGNSLVFDGEYTSSKHLEFKYEYDATTGNLLSQYREGDIKQSFIWGYDDNLPIGKVINAEPNEIFYTSFEEDINATDYVVKTGKYALGVQGDYFIPNSSALPNGDYIVSYWKKTGQADFVFYKNVISHTTGSNIKITVGQGYIDEVRLYPVDAIMTTATFDPSTYQVLDITDENGLSAYFEYDNFHRLYEVTDFEGNVISRNEYNYAQTGGAGNAIYNYVKSFTFLEAGITTGQLPANADNQVEQVQYMDGLGRPIQSIAVGQSTDKEDIVSHIEYDKFGRTPKQFMPFVVTSNDGDFVTNANLGQRYYNQSKYGTFNSFAETEFDNSPLNRAIEQGATGDDWQTGTGHTIRNAWRGNTATEVRDLHTSNPYYAANTLFVTETTDENNIKSWTYTDKFGRTIMTSRAINGGKAETYYQYDDFGRIERVYSPEAVAAMNNTGWNSLTPSDDLRYDYVYDARGRMIEKKIPGAATQYLAYDELDRVVLTQDGNLRANNQWLFTEYDILSRPITTGIYTPTGTNTRSVVQNSIDAAGVVMYESRNSSFNGYSTGNAFPTTNFEILSVTYYDDYDFDGNGTPNHVINGTYTTETPADYIHGKLTGTRVKILDGGNDWLNTVTFYDDRGRVIQIKAENHIGGSDVTTNIYDFAGRVLETVRDHTQTDFSAADANLLILSRFTYDHAGRLLTGTYGIGSDYNTAVAAQIVLNAQEYDQIGQLINKKLHSGNEGCSYLQSVDFEYNIRGWLTAINNPDDLTTTGAKQMCEVNTIWTDPHNNGNTYYYGEEHLMPGEDGIMEIKYDGTIRTYCSWRRVTGPTTSKPMMQLVKHSNGSWYVWDKNFSTRMSRPASFVNVGDVIRLSREGDDFNVYVNGVLEHTIYEPNSSNEELIPVGILTGTGSTEKAFYKERYIASDDLFAMEFGYTTDNASTGAVAQYNGNISQIRWKTVGDAYTSIYGFEYDELNRLVKAKYSEQQGVATNYGNLDRYNVDISYDLNGNIQTLDRKGFISTSNFGDIDQLTYTYKNNSNILESVSDGINTNTKGFDDGNTSGIDYTYDANGNMTKDANKNIEIEYNHMNLPKKVTWLDVNGNPTSKHIEFTYDAAGVKLYKKTNDGSGNTTEKHYVGGIEYAGTATNNIDVEAIYHSEGRLTPNGSSYRYEYTLKDHLGNARVSFADIDNDGNVDQSEVLQTNHYYPFGMCHEGKDLPQQGVTNAYQYNGKELNSDFGLDWLDYGARWYDASIARWSAVDPLAEAIPNHSSYAYTFNNPISFNDPTGMMGQPVGADGLTNEQWMASSRPDGNSNLAREYKNANKKASREVRHVVEDFDGNQHKVRGGDIAGDVSLAIPYGIRAYLNGELVFDRVDGYTIIESTNTDNLYKFKYIQTRTTLTVISKHHNIKEQILSATYFQNWVYNSKTGLYVPLSGNMNKFVNYDSEKGKMGASVTFYDIENSHQALDFHVGELGSSFTKGISLGEGLISISQEGSQDFNGKSILRGGQIEYLQGVVRTNANGKEYLSLSWIRKGAINFNFDKVHKISIGTRMSVSYSNTNKGRYNWSE